MPSPNIWGHPAIYELENRCVDVEHAIESAMSSICSWRGRAFLDLGCGSGFHLPQWARDAARVIGVEPHPSLAALARRRTRALASVTVLDGTAQVIPVPDASVDVLQARWAYFFGPGCEAGLGELDRVMRRGGTAFVIDHDVERSTWGAWFRAGFPMVDPVAVDRFWAGHGWRCVRVDARWNFDNRADLEAVVRIELPHAAAEAALDTASGLQIDHAVAVRWKQW